MRHLKEFKIMYDTTYIMPYACAEHVYLKGGHGDISFGLGYIISHLKNH